jgi:hypothetical protein
VSLYLRIKKKAELIKAKMTGSSLEGLQLQVQK